uniref:Uncharacterized protein n=1 Tax=Anguilla anguilla TaxID=7936 RepID=A0A0E9T8J7_ANGAN
MGNSSPSLLPMALLSLFNVHLVYVPQGSVLLLEFLFSPIW